jgi:hypothetical protein
MNLRDESSADLSPPPDRPSAAPREVAVHGRLNPYIKPAGKRYRSAAAAPTTAPMMPATSSFRARLSAMTILPHHPLTVLEDAVSVSARSGELTAFAIDC